MKEQLIALITFFAFPIVQYLLLKFNTKNEGTPELWYLPDYGFRLVLRNLPRKKTLSNIKYRAIIRHFILPSPGASISTYEDKFLFQTEDMFLFPGTDQILLVFNIELSNNGELNLVWTDKLENKNEVYELEDTSQLIIDYEASIENLFNFDVKIAKRVILKEESLHEFWQLLQEEKVEQKLKIDEVLPVG